jgi:acyl carrier protein
MPAYTEQFIRNEIKSLIAEVTERDAGEIGDSALFREELGVDSLTALEIMFAVDKKFKLKIPDEEYQKLKNVNETVALVIAHLPPESKPTAAA